jgi:hypothetical protein
MKKSSYLFRREKRVGRNPSTGLIVRPPIINQTISSIQNGQSESIIQTSQAQR